MSETTSHTPEDDEPRGITPREIALFCLFGLLPFGVIYVAASQVSDPDGEAFEHNRRLLLDHCRQVLLDRDGCQQRVDERIVVCVQEHPRPEPSSAAFQDYLPTLRRCVNEGAEGWLPPAAPAKRPSRRF
jgi:hypothetical protein